MRYFIFFIIPFFSIGTFCIFILIEFFEYLKKYHAFKWQEISFERPFGINQANFYFYPIKPFKFIPFLFSTDDIDDTKVTKYKKILKLSLLALIFWIIIFYFI